MGVCESNAVLMDCQLGQHLRREGDEIGCASTQQKLRRDVNRGLGGRVTRLPATRKAHDRRLLRVALDERHQHLGAERKIRVRARDAGPHVHVARVWESGRLRDGL